MTMIYWNFFIALYLFFAGVSAGALIASMVADLFGKGRYGHIAKIGALIAPVPIIIGLFTLILDLERPLYFWRLMISFEPTSVMSIGAWILVCFSIISLMFFYFYLPERFDIFKIRQKIVKICSLKSVKIIALVIAVSTALYTGVLLNVLTARPFWDTWMLPFVLLFSGVVDGIAAILLVMYLSPPPDFTKDDFTMSKSFLTTMDLVFMLALILLTVSMIIMVAGLNLSAGNAGKTACVIMGGSLCVMFWLGVVVIGMIVPLFCDTIELIRHHDPGEKSFDRLIAMTAATSVLLGGLMIRFVVVFAGQLTGPVIN